MSRQTKYELVVRDGISFNITLTKASDAKTGFKQGKDGRCLRTVRVLTHGDEKPTTKDDIERVVEWGEIESLYAFRDEETGEEKFLNVDKKVVTAMFKNSSTMRVVGVYSRDTIDWMMLDGYHYFMGVQKDKKTKCANAKDVQVYNLFCQGLSSAGKVMMVKYISSNREKFALIYPQGDGLTMSNLLHSTYMREREPVEEIVIPKVDKMFAKLIGPLDKRHIDLEEMADECEEKLRMYIQDVKDGRPVDKPTFDIKPKTTEMDLFSQIAALDGGGSGSSSEDEEKSAILAPIPAKKIITPKKKPLLKLRS